jgi:hypothetical protein
MIRRVLGMFVISLLWPGVTTAGELTLDQLVGLARQGVGNEVLVALVEVDAACWDLNAQRVLQLKNDGLAEPVIVALLRSGRADDGRCVNAEETGAGMLVVPGPLSPEPRAVAEASYVDYETEPEIVEVPVAVAVPVFVSVDDHHNWRHKPRRRAHTQQSWRSGRFINDGSRPGDAFNEPAQHGRFINDGSRPVPFTQVRERTSRDLVTDRRTSDRRAEALPPPQKAPSRERTAADLAQETRASESERSDRSGRTESSSSRQKW